MFDILKLTGDYIPHGESFFWNPELLWTHVISDTVIGLAYFSIPVTLAILVRKRRELLFSWVFLMVACFTLFSGASHVMEIWTIWEPYYWTEGAVKIGTAIVSAWTAIAIWYLLPRAIDLPGPGELRTKMKERKEAQRKLNRQKAKMRSMIDSVPDVFYLFDEDGNFLDWNEKVPEVTGYTDDEIETMDPLEFTAEDDLDEVRQALNNVFENRVQESVDTALVTKNGETIPYQFTGAPLLDENDELIGLVGSGRDISELKQREQELENTREHLRELNEELEEKVKLRTRELEQFVYAASHDLREPARIIQTYSQFLEEDLEVELSEDARNDLDYLTDASDRMISLIDSLLRLSRVGNQELTLETFPLEEAADDAIKNLQQKVDSTGTDIKRENLPEIEADRALITDLYQNLIDNAIKYSGPDKPQIRLTSEQSDGTWILGVKDRGVGIAPSEKTQVFEPFSHGENSDKQKGTGIGLSICKKIVERHDGDLWVESSPGQGAHFKFTLRTPQGAI